MNQLDTPISSLSAHKSTRSLQDEIRSNSDVVLPAQGIIKQLVWSGSYSADWEVLVYRNGDLWEACFFRWAIHHEHVIGTSFKGVRERAKQRIRKLETARLKSTNWTLTIH